VCGAGPFALVLPGGGVRGIAHVGVIQILDSLGIRPDYVVGTSMGAIVGALYASGYTGKELEALAKRFPVASAIGLQTYFRTPRSLGTAPTLLRWEQGEERGFALDLGAADETRVNNLMSAMMLRGNLIARGDFDRLPIPFRAVAADLVTGKRVVIGRGDLAQAVRTSFAIPLVFQPLLDSIGHPLVDGGIAENVPVSVARELGAKRVLVSQLLDTMQVTVLPTGASIATRMMGLLFEQNAPRLAAGDQEVTSDVSGAVQLDFSDPTIETMLERGRVAGRALARDSCLPRRPSLRGEVPVVARAIVAPGTARAGRRLLQATLGLGPRSRVQLDSVMTRLDRISTTETVRAIWLNPRPRGDSVLFAPELIYAPRRVLAGGLALDSDYGGRVWFGFVDRRLFRDRVEGALRATLGVYRQDLELTGRRANENPEYEPSPFVSVMYGHEQVRLFTDLGDEIPRSLLPDMREGILRAGWELPFGATWRLRAAGLVRSWSGNEFIRDNPGRTTVGLATRLDASVPGGRRAFVGEVEANTRFVRATVAASALFQHRRLKVTPTVRAAWMNRQAPLHLWLPLGDKDGFGGLRIGERIGVAQLYAATDVSHTLVGPLDVVVTAMTGQSTDDPRRPLGGDWIMGARVGLGAETPVGPLRLQYGWNDADRGLWFLRFGRWF
jgi:NTE family protein